MNHVPKFHVSGHFSQCFKVLNPSKYVYNFGKIGYFLDTNEKQAKIMDPERVQNFAIKHRKKNVERRCIFCV